MALLNLCMKFKKFFGQKHSIEALRKWQQEKYSQLVQGSAKSRIYAGKSTKRGFSLKSNDEKNFQPIFHIVHIKSALFLLELAMALVTTIGMRFLQVCYGLPRRFSDLPTSLGRQQRLQSSMKQLMSPLGGVLLRSSK